MTPMIEHSDNEALARACARKRQREREKANESFSRENDDERHSRQSFDAESKHDACISPLVSQIARSSPLPIARDAAFEMRQKAVSASAESGEPFQRDIFQRDRLSIGIAMESLRIVRYRL